MHGEVELVPASLVELGQVGDVARDLCRRQAVQRTAAQTYANHGTTVDHGVAVGREVDVDDHPRYPLAEGGEHRGEGVLLGMVGAAKAEEGQRRLEEGGVAGDHRPPSCRDRSILP
jgi:hypothetical protein